MRRSPPTTSSPRLLPPPLPAHPAVVAASPTSFTDISKNLAPPLGEASPSPLSAASESTAVNMPSKIAGIRTTFSKISRQDLASNVFAPEDRDGELLAPGDLA